MVIKPPTKLRTEPHSAIENIQYKDIWKVKEMSSNLYEDEQMHF